MLAGAWAPLHAPAPQCEGMSVETGGDLYPGCGTHRGEHIPIKAAHRVGLAAISRLGGVGFVLVGWGVVGSPLLLLLLSVFPLLDAHQLHAALLPTDDHCGAKQPVSTGEHIQMIPRAKSAPTLCNQVSLGWCATRES